MVSLRDPTLPCKSKVTNRRSGGRRRAKNAAAAAAAAAAASAAAATAATAATPALNFRLGDDGTEKKIHNFTKTPKAKQSQKISKKLMKINTNVDSGGATKKRMSPSNSTRKTTPIDLFSGPYD